MRLFSTTRTLGIALALLAGIVVAEPAGASGVTDQQQQVQDDLAQINRLNQKAGQLNEQYLGYLNQIDDLKTQIDAAQQQIDAQSAQLATMQSHLAQLAVDQFMGGGSSDALGSILGDPAALTDGLQRDQLVSVIGNAGATSADDYETLLAKLTTERKGLQSKQDQATKLAKQASDAQQQAIAAGQAYQVELAKDQAKLGDLLVQEQQRQQAIAAAAYAKQVADAQAKQAAQDAAAAAAARSANSGSAGGVRSSANPAATPSADPASSGSASSGSTSAGSASAAPTAADPTPAPPPVSSRADIAVAAAKGQVGVPYVFAMASPGVAFDCSGLTSYAWRAAGVSIPHQSAQQYATTPHVAVTDIQPGDLLFFYHPISHVAIYIGNGQEVQAPAPGKTVEISNVDWAGLVGASRPG